MTLRLPAEPRSICVVMMSALGDAVHVLPVIGALKRQWPAARITWIVQPVTHALVSKHPDVSDFVVFRRRRGVAAVRSYRELRAELHGRHFDLLLGLQVYFKAGVVTALADADVKLGFDRRRARDLNWLLTTHRVPARPNAHVQDQYFEFLTYLGVDARPIEWKLGPDAAERAAQHEHFAGLNRPVCSVVVATSNPRKNWDAARYARVCDALAGDLGYTVQLVGGPAAAERALAAEVQRGTRATLRNELCEDVRRMVWLLDGSDLVISPDTGPLHIARALDVPVVGLYGYTNPKRTGPYRRYTDLVVDGYARFPGEPYAITPATRSGGMERVTVDAVLEKVALARARYGAGASPGQRPAGASAGDDEGAAT
jgi:heptosyltransferase I